MIDKISFSSEEHIFVTGINTSMGIAFLASQINRYLDIELSFYTVISAKQKNLVNDKMAVFTNYQPKSTPHAPDESESDRALIDLGDIANYTAEKNIAKFMLIQAKGEQVNMFPKIKQIDYLLISNYPLKKQKTILQGLEGIHYLFDLNEDHLGLKLKYFQELMR